MCGILSYIIKLLGGAMMQIKLRKAEHRMLPEILNWCYDEALRRKETCYVMLDMLTRKGGNRFIFGPAPNAGYVIIASVHRTNDPERYKVYVAWPIVCPEVPHGVSDAGGRYTDYGREICNAVPCEVW